MAGLEGRAFFDHQQRKRRAAQARLTSRPQQRPLSAAPVVSPAHATVTQPLVVPEVTPRLVVIGGPQAREAYDLGLGELIIGREEGSAIWLWDPKVSHHHALLRRQGDQVVIEDLRSTNGTIVNGAGISVPTTLAPGDVITVGDVQLRLESGELPETSTCSGARTVMTPPHVHSHIDETRTQGKPPAWLVSAPGVHGVPVAGRHG